MVVIAWGEQKPTGGGHKYFARKEESIGMNSKTSYKLIFLATLVHRAQVVGDAPAFFFKQGPSFLNTKRAIFNPKPHFR